MYSVKSVVPAVQDLAGEWVKHAAEGTASQTDAVVGWALSRINHADVPSVVHGVVLTLTGDRKAAKHARGTAAKAVKKATQTLRRGRKQKSGSAGLVAFLVGAGLCFGAVMAWRMMARPGEPTPVPSDTTPPDQAATNLDASTNLDTVPFKPDSPVV
ncbi:hypothetical protein [Paenarthrobacter sp. NPDC018779]|uniref:hypothetical protein n=1 Tax=Paenarthrobacter sp. NPDC018779 TaxID=3364375 RepID=UPI0037CA5EA0